jgi:hypothetical protein
MNTCGNLYDGGFLKDVDTRLTTNSGDNPNDQRDLKALVAATREKDRSERYLRLEKILDMDRFTSFVATEVMVCHWDGYAMNKNNYRVYHDLDSDRIVFMPHGMDQMFGVMMADANMPIRPPMQGLVAKELLDTSEGRRRYYERLSELNHTVFNVEQLTNRVRLLAARIDTALAEIGPSAVENHQRAVAALCSRMVERKQNLDEQLAGTPGRTLAFDSDGAAQLTGWTSSTNFGRPLFTQDSDSQGRPILHISAVNGNSVGSWRTKVLLEDGHYTFEARMQTKDVAADPADRRAGAGLRILGRPAAKKSLGSSDWSSVTYDFDVPDGIYDIELVCELRASQGEVWFDASSLRLFKK